MARMRTACLPPSLLLVQVTVNAAKREFVAQAGTRFQKLFDVLESQGMSAVTGSCPTVGAWRGVRAGSCWPARPALHRCCAV